MNHQVATIETSKRADEEGCTREILEKVLEAGNLEVHPDVPPASSGSGIIFLVRLVSDRRCRLFLVINSVRQQIVLAHEDDTTRPFNANLHQMKLSDGGAALRAFVESC